MQHHLDAYPKGNGAYGPDAALLAGRNLSRDFQRPRRLDMYHGQTVPGFLCIRTGFETITLVRQGMLDHA